MLIRKLKAVFSPEQYHGWGVRKKYFEGWYYKILNAEETLAMAFIPGIAMDEGGKRHAFVQVVDGSRQEAFYHQFPGDAFTPKPGAFQIRVDGSCFSGEEIRLNLPGLKGRLQFHDPAKWPVRWYAPGIMGPFSFMPFMECYHGIISMDHSISGQLKYNGRHIDFTGGRGYLEKDWGHSFPGAYIWMQSNHFSRPQTAIKLSLARIPFLGKRHTGFIAGVLAEGKLYQFTSYNLSRLHMASLNKDKVTIVLKGRKYQLEIEALRNKATELISPVAGFMDGRIEESLTAVLKVQLVNKSTRKIILQDTGRNAGLEIAGATNELLTG